ncbi:lipopolysaccharide biosynthesis protein [Aliihoeflea sp. PC F10.4]
MSSGRTRAAVHGIFWSALSGFGPAAVAAGVFVISSRILTPAEFGIVALATSIAMFSSAIAPAGFGHALIQRKDIGRRHLDSVFWLCLAVALVIYGVLVLAAPSLSRWLGEGMLALLLPVIGLRVLFDLATVVPHALLSRAMAFNKMAMRTLIASLVSAGVCLILLAMGYGLWALALSQLASSVAICVGTLLSVEWRPGLRFSGSALRELARYGIFASGHRIINLINLDRILIGSLLGAAALGIFSFAWRIFQILNDLIAGALNAVSYTLLASLQSEEEKLKEAFLFATFASSALSFPVFVGLGAIAGDLVPVVFGDQWLEAVPAIRAFCVIGMLSCIGILQASLINSQGHANWWFYYLVTKQTVTALIILTFYSYGVSVLVFAMAVQTFVMWPAAVWMVLRILKIGAWAYLKPFLAPTLSCLVMLVGVLFVKMEMAFEPAWLRLGAQVGTGALLYCATLALLDRRRIFQIRDLVLKRGAVSA